MPGVIDSTGTPIRSPFTGRDHRVRVLLRTGFEYTEAEYGSSTTKGGGKVPLDWTNGHSHFATLHLTGKGPVR